MSETRLVRACIKWAKAQGGDAYHVHGSAVQRSGEPDIDGWIPRDGGHVHFKIEAKVGSNQPSKIQLKRLRDYARGGYTTGVCYSLEEFIDIVTQGRTLT